MEYDRYSFDIAHLCGTGSLCSLQCGSSTLFFISSAWLSQWLRRFATVMDIFCRTRNLARRMFCSSAVSSFSWHRLPRPASESIIWFWKPSSHTWISCIQGHHGHQILQINWLASTRYHQHPLRWEAHLPAQPWTQYRCQSHYWIESSQRIDPLFWFENAETKGTICHPLSWWILFNEAQAGL